MKIECLLFKHVNGVNNSLMFLNISILIMGHHFLVERLLLSPLVLSVRSAGFGVHTRGLASPDALIVVPLHTGKLWLALK